MKTRKLFGMLLLFLFIMGFTGCGSDNDEKKVYPLLFEKESYEIPLLREKLISISGGNRDYSVTVEKTDILDVTVDLSNPAGMGYLVISPKLKGETTITIKDNVVNETVKLKIKVTDDYLAYAMRESNHPALSSKTIVYLINNEAKDCYFFRNANSENKLITKGTYGVSVQLESGGSAPGITHAIPYLTLNYASDKDGNFTDAAIPPTPHKLRFELFDGVTSVNTVINMIERYLGVDWEKLVKEEAAKNIRSSIIDHPFLKTTIDDTNYVIIGTLNTMPSIPENILD